MKFRLESEGCGNLGISRQHSLNSSNSMAAGSTHCYPSPCSTQLDRMSGTGGQDWQCGYKWAHDVVALPFFLPNPYEPHVLTSRHVDICYWVHYFASLQMDLVHIAKSCFHGCTLLFANPTMQCIKFCRGTLQSVMTYNGGVTSVQNWCQLFIVFIRCKNKVNTSDFKHSHASG